MGYVPEECSTKGSHHEASELSDCHRGRSLPVPGVRVLHGAAVAGRLAQEPDRHGQRQEPGHRYVPGHGHGWREGPGRSADHDDGLRLLRVHLPGVGQFE